MQEFKIPHTHSLQTDMLMFSNLQPFKFLPDVTANRNEKIKWSVIGIICIFIIDTAKNTLHSLSRISLKTSECTHQMAHFMPEGEQRFKLNGYK